MKITDLKLSEPIYISSVPTADAHASMAAPGRGMGGRGRSGGSGRGMGGNSGAGKGSGMNR